MFYICSVKLKLETMSNEITDVMFRVDTTKDFKGDVIAVFPHDVETSRGDVGYYVHVGQHSSGDYHRLIQTSRPATEEEAKDLRRELESHPYHYKFRVVRCQNRKKFAQLLTELRKKHS